MLSSIAAETIYDLTTTSAVKHIIKLIPGKETPIKQKIRGIPMHCQATFNEDIRNMFHSGKFDTATLPGPALSTW
jgi:hypothetical protein